MNSKNDTNISLLNELRTFFNVEPVLAKPKICSRECSPPKEEGSSDVRGNRARGNERVNSDRGNQLANRFRGSDQVATARVGAHSSRIKGSEQVERAGASVSSNGNVNVGKNVGSINADQASCAVKVKNNKASDEVNKTRGNQNVVSASQFVDKAGGGDVSSPQRESISRPKKTDNNNVNMDKIGASITGSRKGQIREENITKLKSQDHTLEPTGQSTKPGLLRHIHDEARHRIPQCFEGAVVLMKQGVATSNWVMGHSMSFSSVSPGGYKILLSYTEKDKSDAVPYFVLEAAPGGQMSSELRASPTQGTRATVVAQIADKQLYSFESIFDVYFKNSTASILAVNKEFIALHYLKSLTKRLSLGVEVVSRGSRSLWSASAAARWRDGDHSLSTTLGDRGLDVCYARSIKPFLTVASMLEIGFGIQRAVATLAYEWHTQAWTVRASVDSDGLVGATLHQDLGGRRARLACAVSALLNHPNDKFKLGFGITAAVD